MGLNRELNEEQSENNFLNNIIDNQSINQQTNKQTIKKYNFIKNPHYHFHQHKRNATQMLEIGACNTHGIDRNINFINKAAEYYDVLFLVEHWQQTKDTLEAIVMNNRLFDIHFWPASKSHKNVYLLTTE